MLLTLRRYWSRWVYTPSCTTVRGTKTTWGLRGPGGEIAGRWGLGLKLIYWGQEDDPDRWTLLVHLFYPALYINLGRLWGLAAKEPHDMGGREWGFTIYGSSLHWGWGRETTVISLPWSNASIGNGYLLTDGKWLFRHRLAKLPYQEEQAYLATLVFYKQDFLYDYPLRRGEVQQVIATVMGVEYVFAHRWWLPIDALLYRWGIKLSYRSLTPPWVHHVRNIKVEFNQEVGDEAGSWKGGVLGTSHEIQPGQSIEDALRNMEANRQF